MIDVGLILHHDRQVAADFFQEIIFDDGYDDAGRADILLDTGIDEVKGLDIDGTAEKVAGHIAEQRHVEGGKTLPLRPVNRIVRRHIDVVRIRFYGEAVRFGNIRKSISLTRSDFIGFAEKGRRFHSLIGPDAGIQIPAAIFQEIGCMHGKLHTAAAFG